MSENKKSTEPTREEIIDGLVLPLGSRSAPFALIGEEANFGPEDWAWLFLSMNREYADAFHERVQTKVNLYTGDDFQDPIGEDIWYDTDETCATRFGLAAWLNPSAPALPRFREKDDSWFFPLKRPIVEDYRRKEVSDRKYVRVGPTYSRQLDRYRHMVANETTYGYRRPLNIPTEPQSPGNTLGITWVAVDCSIPPEGQLSALRTQAFANRERLRDHGWTTNDDSNGASVVEISESDAFEHLHFRRSAGSTAQVTDLAAVWRAVQIDALGPIVSQMEFLAKRLGEIHEKLLLDGFAAPPPFRRFRNTLPSVKGDDGVPKNGGSYFKALLVIAELAMWGNDASKIAQLTGIIDENKRYRYSWQKQFHEDIDRYMDEARHMIDGGYRLLIHAQKPNASELD